MTPRFGLLGAGAQAMEAEDWCGAPAAFYAVDRAYADPTLRRHAIDDPPAELWDTPVTGAVGPPGTRRRLVGLWPGRRFFTIVSAHAVVSRSARVGVGSLLAPLAVVSTDVLIGEHCLVNIGATVSHDVVLEDFATLSPGVHVAGQCRIEAGAVLGVGANVLPGRVVGQGAVVGAGAVLTKDARPGGVYVGVPARLVAEREDWATTL